MDNLRDVQTEITQLLQDYHSGDKKAYDKLFNIVYAQLKKVAHNIKFHNPDNHTMNTTALVHEAYLKIVNNETITWESRQHFYSLASKAIRQILIDSARKKLALKRNSSEKNPFDDPFNMSEETAYDIEALEYALKKLEKRYAVVSKIVECRFFVGMTVKETAEVLEISPATVKRNWAMGKMYLYHEIRKLGGTASQIEF